MKTVELQAAYHYHCEECGEPNFVMPIAVEMSPEDHERYFREFHDMEPWQELPENYGNFELVCIPDRVVCRACGEGFRTVDARPT